MLRKALRQIDRSNMGLGVHMWLMVGLSPTNLAKNDLIFGGVGCYSSCRVDGVEKVGFV